MIVHIRKEIAAFPKYHVPGRVTVYCGGKVEAEPNDYTLGDARYPLIPGHELCTACEKRAQEARPGF